MPAMLTGQHAIMIIRPIVAYVERLCVCMSTRMENGFLCNRQQEITKITTAHVSRLLGNYMSLAYDKRKYGCLDKILAYLWQSYLNVTFNCAYLI